MGHLVMDVLRVERFKSRTFCMCTRNTYRYDVQNVSGCFICSDRLAADFSVYFSCLVCGKPAGLVKKLPSKEFFLYTITAVLVVCRLLANFKLSENGSF
jgi:hypothetical protein